MSLMRTHNTSYARSKYHTQLAKMSFDKIFDLTAGVYVYFCYTAAVSPDRVDRCNRLGYRIMTAAAVTLHFFSLSHPIYCDARILSPSQ